MADIRIIKHEAIPQCGSFEVRFSDGRPSQYFYWEDLPGRRLRSDLVTSVVALEQAKALARVSAGTASACSPISAHMFAPIDMGCSWLRAPAILSLLN